MAQYNKMVLHKLLDTYESSLLSIGENIRTIHIEFRFTKKNFPQYFDESSTEYENIHILMQELEHEGFIKIIWKGRKIGHIIEKVQLCVENVQDVYAYVKRVPKSDLESFHLAELKDCLQNVETPICKALIEYLIERLETHKSVKEFIELDRWEETKHLLKAISLIEKNEDVLYFREFSILAFGDSKILEGFEGKIANIFKRFHLEFEHMDSGEILAEYNIYHTPNYVYLKGDIKIAVGEEMLDLSALKQGIGISGEDIDRLQLVCAKQIDKVITIENLTTFFRWNEPNSLIIYLGGYHNRSRRILLQEIYSSIPNVSYKHFGDIDAGGFEIYRDLCEKTGIPFEMYHMSLEVLKQYEVFGKTLTTNDRKRLETMKSRNGLGELIEYMLEHNVKLEQECIAY